jgi:hypothetical protein
MIGSAGALMVERSGGSLLVSFICADRILHYHVKDRAQALEPMLNGYGCGTEQDCLRLFVFHGIYLLSFHCS